MSKFPTHPNAANGDQSVQRGNIPALSSTRSRSGVGEKGQSLSGPRLSKQDWHLQVIRHLLSESFSHICTPDKAHLLVFNDTAKAYPAEAEVLVGTIKKLAADQAGSNVSEGVIRAAIHIFREEPCNCVPVIYGRAGRDSNGNYYVFGQESFWHYPAGQQFRYGPQSPDLPFILPEASVGTPFRISQGNAPQSLEALFEAVNLPEESTLLILAWMVNALMPWRQMTLLELVGPPGSGKSTAQAAIKQIIDPSTSLLDRDLPKTRKDVLRKAQDDYLISLDNVNSLSRSVQRELFTVMRGTTIKWQMKRKSFETPVRVACPLIINSVESVVTDEELANATLTIELPWLRENIPDQLTQWLTQGKLESTYNGLLDLLGYVHYYLPGVTLNRDVPSGMQDFCRIGSLVAHWLKGDQAVFWEQFDANQLSRREFEFDENPVARALCACLDTNQNAPIEQTMGEWLEMLNEFRPETASYGEWPTTPRGMGAKFKLAQPLLRHSGIELASLGKRGPNCTWRLAGGASDDATTAGCELPLMPTGVPIHVTGPWGHPNDITTFNSVV